MRHVFDKLDGGFGTSGPESFKGEIGKAVTGDIHLLDVQEFRKVPSALDDIPESVLGGMSRDYVLLYRYAKAVISGVLPESLVSQKSGLLNHARWGTLAQRVLILYTRTESPCEEFKLMVTFIVQVYCVILYESSHKSKFTCGAPHLFHMMKLVLTQSERVQQIAMPVVQNNAYYAHPENILVAMVEDREEAVRREAITQNYCLEEERAHQGQV